MLDPDPDDLHFTSMKLIQNFELALSGVPYEDLIRRLPRAATTIKNAFCEMTRDTSDIDSLVRKSGTNPGMKPVPLEDLYLLLLQSGYDKAYYMQNWCASDTLAPRRFKGSAHQVLAHLIERLGHLENLSVLISPEVVQGITFMTHSRILRETVIRLSMCPRPGGMDGLAEDARTCMGMGAVVCRAIELVAAGGKAGRAFSTANDVIAVKPNLMGVGLDLNALFRRVLKKAERQ